MSDQASSFLVSILLLECVPRHRHVRLALVCEVGMASGTWCVCVHSAQSAQEHTARQKLLLSTGLSHILSVAFFRPTLPMHLPFLGCGMLMGGHHLLDVVFASFPSAGLACLFGVLKMLTLHGFRACIWGVLVDTSECSD